MGTRIPYIKTKHFVEDHPHACGDKRTTALKELKRRGSSPRVWGQDSIDSPCVQGHGIIPTRVGTRAINNNTIALNQDHPHACGDKPVLDIATKSRRGSSPRVWGQAHLRQGNRRLQRIIPTRVGTSCRTELFCRRFRDHPHACGDKSYVCDIISAKLGSSPRVWGQVVFTSL